MTYLILGATGTLGRAMTKALLSTPATLEVRALSRDELKLSQFEQAFNDKRVSTIIGDIRDKPSIMPAFDGVDVVFHFAALKRIPEMEKHPLESIKTNLLGTVNAADAAMVYRVPHFVFSSTDKACMPINTYGASKFLSEQILFNFNSLGKTNFSVYRWGNIITSRGAVVHQFRDAIENEQAAKITNVNMTRFWIRIEEAVQFVLDTYKDKSNEVKVPKMRAAKVSDVLGAVGDILGKEPRTEVIGMRPGEKLHEDIRYIREWNKTINSLEADQFTRDELVEFVRGAL